MKQIEAKCFKLNFERPRRSVCVKIDKINAHLYLLLHFLFLFIHFFIFTSIYLYFFHRLFLPLSNCDLDLHHCLLQNINKHQIMIQWLAHQIKTWAINTQLFQKRHIWIESHSVTSCACIASISTCIIILSFYLNPTWL